jgi:hypothetical protein
LIAQRIRLIDQQGHAGTMLNGVIVNKMQLRQRMDMDPLTQFAAQETCCAFQSTLDFFKVI